MVAEIITGLVAGVTAGYLYTRRKAENNNTVTPVDKITISKPVPEHERYWWKEVQKRRNS